MNNLLVGNGVNINFTGTTFTNTSIINRALIRTRTRKSKNDYSKESAQLLEYLFKETHNTLQGKNDQFIFTGYDKQTLGYFKSKYGNKVNLKIFDIGLEDYFFLYEIFCYKNNITNPNQYDFRELLRRMFLDSIYFNGQIQKIWEKFPKSFITYLCKFNQIFTTNYDANLENSTKMGIYHLHGSFAEIDDKYNPDSFRNKLSDMRHVDYTYVKNHPHLYSTALFAYCGDMKEFSTQLAINANSGIDGFARGFSEGKANPVLLAEWRNSDSQMLRNFAEGIILKQNQPEICVSEPYMIHEFKKIKDTLEIIGLSPYNDDHVFKWIKENVNLNKIVFYYFDKNEIETVTEILGTERLECLDVKQFWRNLRIASSLVHNFKIEEA